MIKQIFLLTIFLGSFSYAQSNPDLQKLAREFWAWRIVQQPATGDDIPRVERPDGWTPDWSPKALARYRQKYRDFHDKLDSLPRDNWQRADSVDYLCLRAQIERVNWELNVLRAPHRNPDFYVHQTLGAVYELLLIDAPMTEARLRNIIRRLNSVPKTIKAAKVNLTEPSRPFADIAWYNTGDILTMLERLFAALQNDKKIPEKTRIDLLNANDNAMDALVDFRNWMRKKRPKMSADFSCGREAYEYFLKNIALIPYTPEQLLQMGRQEWERAAAFETYEKQRNRALPEPSIFKSAKAQIEQGKKDEIAIREFLEKNDIMTVPNWLRHYINKPRPERILPLAHMGVVDDLTSETRLDQNAVSYIPKPSRKLPYFGRSRAIDPRPLMVHEGIPGHYFQLANSWKNPDLIRRHFVDSGANEGIGFYVEELMQQFGLFDDRPKTREIIYNFMRLRALRVEVDIRLALGTFDIKQAGEYLAKTVPMDKKTAFGEAGFFAYNPGQAISYQIGKLQIYKFLSDAKIRKGDQFSLREFHDFLMQNGNVPIALLRWEWLGLCDEIGQFFE